MNVRESEESESTHQKPQSFGFVAADVAGPSSSSECPKSNRAIISKNENDDSEKKDVSLR